MTAVSVFGLLFSSCDIDIRNCNALTGEEPASLLPLLAAIEGRIAEYCRILAVENRYRTGFSDCWAALLNICRK